LPTLNYNICIALQRFESFAEIRSVAKVNIMILATRLILYS